MRNRFLSTLDAEDREQLTPHMRRVALHLGQILFEEGAAVTIAYFPEDAVVSLMTVLIDGWTVESANSGFETGVELLNASTGSTTTSRVVVQMAGEAWALPSEALRARLLSSPKLVRHVMTHAQGSACRCGQAVACGALHGAQERLAKWLLITADRMGEDHYTITQEALAEIMGLQRTTVTAVAAHLKDMGLIDYRRGRLEIIDRDALTDAACECYASAGTRAQAANAA